MEAAALTNMDTIRRPISLILVVVLTAAFAVPAIAAPENTSEMITVDNIRYITSEADDTKTAVVVGCDELEELKVPDTVSLNGEELAVTAVGEDQKLTGCAGLKKVAFGENVQRVGDLAFSGCSGLENVVLPSSLSYLGEGAFQNCSGLKSADLRSGLKEVPGLLFQYCGSLETITLPEGCASIGESAFEGCSSLSIDVPATVTSIGDHAFGAGTLVVESNKSYSMSGCTSVTLQRIADDTKIGSDAFAGCQSLTAFYDGTEVPSSIEKAKKADKYLIICLRAEKDGISYQITRDSNDQLTAQVTAIPSILETLELPEKIEFGRCTNDPSIAETEGTYTVSSFSDAALSTLSSALESSALESGPLETVILPSSIEGVSDILAEAGFEKGDREADGRDTWVLSETGQGSEGPEQQPPQTDPIPPQQQEPAPEVCEYCGSTEHSSQDCPTLVEPTPTPEDLCPVCGLPHGSAPCPLIPAVPSLPTPVPVAPAAPASAAPSVSAAASASPEPEESAEPSAYELPPQPLDMENMEVWEVVPPADARRLNGQFTFEARGNDVDRETARDSVLSWAVQNFGDDVTVTFQSDTDTVGRAAQPSTLRTGDEVYIETPDGTRCSYDIAIRGDVASSLNADDEPGALTELIHIIGMVIAEQHAAEESGSESPAPAASPSVPEASTAPQPVEVTLNASQMSRAGTRPAPRPTASKKKVTAAQKEAADVNGSGDVTITDAVLQAKYMKEPHPDGAVYPNGPKQTAWESDNKGLQGYMNSRRWARLSSSYLMTNNKGGISRVEYVGDAVLVEDYDADLNLVMSRQLPMELEKWGGFYSGKNYNYVIYGQDNDEESKTKEVVRVVQYSKNWKRIGSDSMYGANTSSPFLAGALRCAEYKGYVYIRTCHNMFTGKEGIRHQANMLIVVREKDMKITDTEAEVIWGTGLVSHSFNQFVLVDKDGKLVGLDHGDGNPRALALRRYLTPAGEDKIVVADGQSMEVEVADIQEIVGEIGDNDTGCSLGGFEETEKGYVAAYGYDGKGERREPRNIYFSFTSRDLKKTVKTQLTSGEDVQVPMLVSTGLDGGYIMWAGAPDKDRNRVLNYARYDENGKVGKTKTLNAGMSDCHPIIWDGKIVWYVTDESGPVFYSLPLD